jgi:hypothetical protein
MATNAIDKLYDEIRRLPPDKKKELYDSVGFIST